MSIVGNIINGLPESDIALIDKDKLRLNRFYVARNKARKANSAKRNRMEIQNPATAN